MTNMKLFGTAAAALALSAGTASADITFDLGGGWEATIFDKANVDLEVDFVDLRENVLVLEKFAKFVDLSPQDIVFTQNEDDANTVSRIVLTEEFIFNNTEFDWDFFTMELLGGVATFDPDASADFSIDPFDTMTFGDGDTSVVFSGGVIESDGHWNPGFESGGLVINVDLSGEEPATFTLREIPVPAPGAFALLAGAGLVARRRRRA